MKKQAVLAFALTIVASYYFSEILDQDTKAEINEASNTNVVVQGSSSN